jgi:hypothetical protein
MSTHKARMAVQDLRKNELADIPGAKEQGAANETRTAVDLIDRIKGDVNRTLDQSQNRIKWVNGCVTALSQNESFNSDGTFNPTQTTSQFKKNGGIESSCPALWDKQYAKTPVVDVVQQELFNSRMYLALSKKWSDPASATLNISSPTWKGEFFKDMPLSIAKLNDYEKSKIVESRDRLLQECLAANKSECLSADALQEYAAKRYRQQISENPIIMYFTRSVDPRAPIKGSEIAEAYRKHQAKMNRLKNVKLNDQDYLKFNYFLDKTINNVDPGTRGDYCEVAGALLANFKSKENFDTMVISTGLAAGGVAALTAKGVFGRLLAFMSGTSGFADAYLVSQMATHYDVMRKIEATCSQSHLQMPEVCNVETIHGNADSLVVDGVALSVSGVMTSVGLYGPAKNLILKALPTK